MKRALVTVLVIIILLGAGAFMYLRHGYVYEISQAEIQSRVESQFPVEKCVLVFCIELRKPEVRLEPGQSRVHFGSNAFMEVAFSSKEYDGTVGFSGVLQYRPGPGAFFLADSRLEYFDVNGVSEKNKDKLEKLATLLVADYLRASPIYSFTDTAFEPVASWLELKEVLMRENTLRLRIGLAVN